MVPTVVDGTVSALLRNLFPRLAYHTSLARKVEIMEALRELRQQEQEGKFLSPEFQDVLENGERIKAEFKVSFRGRARRG